MATSLRPAAPFDGDGILPLSQAKLQLHVLHNDEDDLIAAMRDAAIDWVEGYTATGLSRRGWVWQAAGFTPELRLAMSPVVSIESIAYLGTGGAALALTAPDWRIVGNSVLAAAGRYWPYALAGAGAVTVSFTAGHADAAAEAPALIAAVQMLLAHLYRNREAVLSGPSFEVPFGVRALCDVRRTPVIG